MPWESKKWRGVTLMFLHYQMVVVSVHWVVHKVEVEQSAQTTILFCPLYWIEPLRRETTLCALSIKYYFFRDRNVTNKLFPMFLLWLFCFPATGVEGWCSSRVTTCAGTDPCTQDPVPKMLSVPWRRGRKGEGRMFLFTMPATVTLQQPSNCCGDKRKQSAAHPHTAGYCCTKDDCLHWYKKQCVLFLKLKTNSANIYSERLDSLDSKQIDFDLIGQWLLTICSISPKNKITTVTFDLVGCIRGSFTQMRWKRFNDLLLY